MSKLQAIAIPDEVVMSKIFIIREQKIILDRDLAKLY
ncbi:ORF6N domain-containing protein [Pedobacter segetis]|nr:ORF6N domain-containing protein [Pedobacter segetis]